MLFRETVAVYCENQSKHTNTFFGHNVELQHAVHAITTELIKHRTFEAYGGVQAARSCAHLALATDGVRSLGSRPDHVTLGEKASEINWRGVDGAPQPMCMRRQTINNDIITLSEIRQLTINREA
jgi:hypothetical protein